MKKIVLFLSLICVTINVYSQVGINTTSPDAQLHVKSTNQAAPNNTDGILIPKIDAFPITNPTAAQQGMMVYLTTLSAGKQPGFYYWDNTGTPQWKGIGGNSGWQITGNTGTNPATNFIGTIDSVDVVFRRNNTVSGKIGGTSTAYGFESLPASSTGNNNTAIGSQSMSSNTIGVENVAVGKETLFVNSTGSLNTAVGFRALGNSDAGDNTAIGGNAMVNNYSGESNVAIGVESLFSNFDGINNTAIGRDALHQSSDGQNNTALGYAAGNLITSGSDNTAIGAFADVPNPTASNQLSIANVIFGTGTNSSLTSKIGINEPAPNAKLQINASSQANPNNSDGLIIPRISVFPLMNPGASQNGMMVFLTAPLAQSGFYYWDNPNVSWKGIGANTGWGLNGNVGTLSNFIGTTNPVDVFFKRNNINSGRIADRNTAFGFNCLNPLTSGLYNVAFGVNALATNTSGLNNTAFGDGALRKNTTGGENSAYGSDALRENLLGSDNIANGFFTMSDNTNASKNIAIGRMALRNQNFSNGGVTYDTNNVAIGVEALYSNNPTIASPDVNANGKANTALGNYALRNNSTGTNNVASGYESLYSNTTGSNNVAIGKFSLKGNTIGARNVAIGTESLWTPQQYSDNTAIGYHAIASSQGNKNTAVGSYALSGSYSVLTEQGNSALGYYALSQCYGTMATAIGFEALKYSSAEGNTAIGAKALSGVTFGTTGTGLVAVGYKSMMANTNGSYGTAIGNESMFSNTSGINNTALGFQSLYLNSLGSNNIAIGYQAAYNETGSNKLYIENSNATTPLIYGEFNNDLLRFHGNLEIDNITTFDNKMQVVNKNNYQHSIGNQILGSGGDDFIISSKEGANETAGVYGDGNAVTIWSAGDANGGQSPALVYFLDEDAFDASNTNPYDASTVFPNPVALKSYITPAGAYFQVSDKNKKENILKIENSLEKINQISGYTYQFKLAEAEIKKGDKPIKSSGVLAQEVEKILPEAIQKNEFGDYFVDYAAITPLLIEAIKEQNTKIETLEQRLKAIEEKLSR